jgi:hypothetical protein
MLSRSIAKFVALGWLPCLLTPAAAFDIDEASCTGEKADFIKNAVADAQRMANAGKKAVFANQYGNTREKIWMTNDPLVLQEVES